jgi:hypothetical protein
MSSDTATEILTNLIGKSGTDRPVIVGDLTQVGSDYTATSYAAAVPASNAGYHLVAPGLGAAGNVGKLVTNAAQSKFAFILSGDGANDAMITQPHSYDPTTRTGATTGVSFTAGETERVWSLPSLSQWPYSGMAQVPGVWKCTIKRSTLNQAQFGDSAVTIVASSLDGILARGGNNGTFTGCVVQGSADIALYGGGGMTLRNCGTIVKDIDLFDGDYIISNSLIITGSGSTLVIGAGATVEAFASLAQFGIFNSGTAGAPGIQLGHGGRLACYGNNPIFGATDYDVLQVGEQCAATIDVTVSYATTTFAGGKPINVKGTRYNYADVPITNTAANASVTQFLP